jgi:hypothetical protein
MDDYKVQRNVKKYAKWPTIVHRGAPPGSGCYWGKTLIWLRWYRAVEEYQRVYYEWYFDGIEERWEWKTILKFND